MGDPIRLVVGLGNPGREHEATRHNAGFWFVEALARGVGVAFAHESRFRGEIAKAGPEVRLVKPMTYMNLSGQSAGAAARFFGVAAHEMLVVHDELDLPAGEARLKFGGGVAGHNGLKDIRATLGTPDFWRLRLGIGHPRDSEIPQQQVADYVLRPPRRDERTGIEAAIDRGLAIWPHLAAGDFERAMTALHTKEAS